MKHNRAHIIHHRHSFRLVHHRHTGYPYLFFMLMLCGLLTFAWTSMARGASYDVRAAVPAVPLTQPAIISTPNDGAVLTSDITTVTGSCQQASYIKVYRNRVFAGTAVCETDGTFSIKMQLTPGSNRIDAQGYNVTDAPGPTSDPVTVTYAAPQTNTPPETGGTTDTGTDGLVAEPSVPVDSVLLTSAFTYRGIRPDKLESWLFTITGGMGPYAVSVDWGDGQTDLKSLKQSGDFSLEHTYERGAGYSTQYTITVTATDVAGQRSLLQLFVIVSPAATGSASSGLSSNIGGTGSGVIADDAGPTAMQQFWRVAAPVYGVTVVAAASFWLGELHQVGQIGTQLHRFKLPWRWRF